MRSTRSLIQTFGRAARNVHGQVIMYADNITASMQAAIDETARRRAKQTAWNSEHGIIPKSTTKSLESPLDTLYVDNEPGKARGGKRKGRQTDEAPLTVEETAKLITSLEREMRQAARDLEFEQAAEIRDRIRELRKRLLAMPCGEIQQEVEA